jgi:AP-2 complex subunit mu-1
MHENLYIVAAASSNPNAAMIFEFLYKVISLGHSYFGVFNEQAVKDNFTLIYELFDEICDFGFPQTTDSDTLKLYITTDTIRSEKTADASKIAIQATGAVSWRRADIKYRKNEMFVDIIESVNLIMSSKGTVLRADVSGQIMMRAYLSGMPECKFGLNDKFSVDKKSNATTKNNAPTPGLVEIDDCQFHQCVKLAKFDSERTINFVPPDGEFEMMRYRTTDNVSLPFKVYAVVNEISTSRVEFKICIKSQYAANIFAQNVVVKVPTPTNTSSTNINVPFGKAKYNGGENAIIWKIARFGGKEELVLSATAELTLTTTKKKWSKPPISIDFQVLSSDFRL